MSFYWLENYNNNRNTALVGGMYGVWDPTFPLAWSETTREKFRKHPRHTCLQLNEQ